MATAIHTGPAKAEPIWFIDNLARVLVDGSASGGTLAIVEMTGRRGDMPPLHLHNHEDEAFFVLEGSLVLHLPGRRRIDLAVGEAAAAPKGIPHTYRVESDEARWLAIATPAGFDAFVREAGEPAERSELPPAGREQDTARLGAIAALHGIELLGPPGCYPE